MDGKFLKAIVLAALVFIAAYFVSVRAIHQKYSDQIKVLKSEIQMKDLRIIELEENLKMRTANFSVKAIIQVAGISPMDVQSALKKSGMYAGALDGRISQSVIDAIKKFQRKNGIRPDGVVGKKTWSLLREQR